MLSQIILTGAEILAEQAEIGSATARQILKKAVERVSDLRAAVEAEPRAALGVSTTRSQRLLIRKEL